MEDIYYGDIDIITKAHGNISDQIGKISEIGAMAVTVCGPGGFNDSVRAAVRRRVGLRSIDFFEEAFSS